MPAAKPYRPVLIVHTGDPHADILEAEGDYAQMLQRAAGLADEDVEIVPVFRGALPGAPGDYSAALVTGSPANVTDRDAWGESTAHWLRTAAGAGLPLFGVCYGHQLLAHALGGDVDFNPAGRETGTGMLQVRPEARRDPLLDGLPAEFAVQLQHMQTITRLPPGATSLARSALDENQLVRMGERIVSTQFHPEFTPAVPRADLARRGAEYAAEGLDVAALQASVRPTPEAGTLLRRFLALYAPDVPTA